MQPELGNSPLKRWRNSRVTHGRATRGNLKNEIKRLVAPVREKSITEDHLDGSIRNLSAFIPGFQPKVEAAPKATVSRSLLDAVEQLERRLIEEALRIRW